MPRAASGAARKVSHEKACLLRAEATQRGLTSSEAVEETIDAWLSGGNVVKDSVADDEAWRRPRSHLLREARGMYVVIAEGRLVRAYPSLEEAAEKLRELKAPRSKARRAGEARRRQRSRGGCRRAARGQPGASLGC